jgi:AcrR family transcriptional regulator
VRAILQAAAQVLEAEGIDATTTDRIALRAGVSVGSLYQYFPSKEAVIAMLARCHLIEAGERLAPFLARLDGRPPVAEVVPELVRICVELHASRPRLHHLLLEDRGVAQDARADLARGWHRLTARVEAYFRAIGGDRMPRPDLAAELVLETAFTLAHRFLIAGRSAAEQEARTREVVALFEGYLGGRGSR